jgi:hypothetical protein
MGLGVAGVGEGRCGDGGSTEDRAGAARSRGGGSVLAAGVQEGSEEVARKLPRVDVVLLVSPVRPRGAERRDDGEAERRRWTGLPAWRSSGVNVRVWRRPGREALVGCSGASGA